jgi:16S rRNA (adenine1518-N6/adenine1519-N6)-dimethyltransferase
MNVSVPGNAAAIMRKYGITAKKSLGQNFLVDANVLRNIVRLSGLDKTRGALEIGPGIGALTQVLAEAAGRVVAVEIDRRLLPVLEETLAPYDNVTVVHGDILKVDLHRLFEEHFAGAAAVSVVANLPYYVTTPILMALLEARLPLENIVVMVQKEVGERITASPGSKAYGSLSIAVQYYCDAEIAAIVPPTVFVPRPDVESAVIRLARLEKPRVEVRDEAFLFEVVQASFAQRRKTLLNNLQAKFGKDRKEHLHAALADAGIAPERRGETLSLPEFAALADALAERLASRAD